MIDPVFRTGKNYPQVFLGKCKHFKEKKMPEYITGNKGIYFDSDREDSDDKNSNERNSDEENFDEENYV